jgi:predicted secreted protein
MTNAVTGKAGVVTIGATVNEVTAWNVDRTTEAVDVTSMSSSGNGEYVAGLFRWNGAFTTLNILNKTGSQAAASFDVGATRSAYLPRVSGAIIITNEPVNCPVDGRVEYGYTFQGTGACTVATA